MEMIRCCSIAKIPGCNSQGLALLRAGGLETWVDWNDLQIGVCLGLAAMIRFSGTGGHTPRTPVLLLLRDVYLLQGKVELLLQRVSFDRPWWHWHGWH